MSSTTFTAASPHAIKLWSRKSFNDSVKATLFGKLAGKSDRSIVQVKDELKSEGDRVRFGLRTLPTGDGVQDDETLEGNEEGLDFRYFDLNLGEKRHAFKVDLNLSAQRSMFDVRAEAKAACDEWLEDYIDTTFFEYLSGYSALASRPTGKYHKSGALGGNTLLTPSADRIVYGGTATSHATLQATDVMSLTVIDRLVEKAKLASPTMRKASFDGKNLWVLILHPYQVTDLRSNTAAGQWYDIQKAASTGGLKDAFAGETLGVYREVLIIESTRVSTFSDGGAGGNILGARALFLGAQAAVTAHGRDTDQWGKMKAVERTFDYGKRFGIGITLIWGMAKTRFNNQSDFGCYVVETAAAPHG